jgi:hypothetical protein
MDFWDPTRRWTRRRRDSRYQRHFDGDVSVNVIIEDTLIVVRTLIDIKRSLLWWTSMQHPPLAAKRNRPTSGNHFSDLGVKATFFFPPNINY